MAEMFMINGQAVAPPKAVVEASLAKDGPGRAAIDQWFAEQDAPHAKAALQRSGLKAADVTCTGFKGAMLTSDVERAVIAKQQAAAAPAPATDPKAAEDPAAEPTKEG